MKHFYLIQMKRAIIFKTKCFNIPESAFFASQEILKCQLFHFDSGHFFVFCFQNVKTEVPFSEQLSETRGIACSQKKHLVLITGTSLPNPGSLTTV